MTITEIVDREVGKLPPGFIYQQPRTLAHAVAKACVEECAKVPRRYAEQGDWEKDACVAIEHDILELAAQGPGGATE